MLHLIRSRWPSPDASLPQIALPVSRQTLEKRRWQMETKNGFHFGFDLETPLADGDVIFESETDQYILAQQPEAVLEIHWHEADEAARLGWSLGNLHFPVEIRGPSFLVSDDPAVRLMLQRNHIHFRPALAVFRPLKAVSHHHGHEH
jgi:urease accessory protein